MYREEEESESCRSTRGQIIGYLQGKEGPGMRGS